MSENNRELIEISTHVTADLDHVWNCWTKPDHITKWNFAADSWHCPHAINDLKAGGTFSWRMEAKDGSMGFDFAGTYRHIEDKKHIESELGDGRKIFVAFNSQDDGVLVVERFEAESMNPVDMQRQGWQNILDNFKKYAESMTNE